MAYSEEPFICDGCQKILYHNDNSWYYVHILAHPNPVAGEFDTSLTKEEIHNEIQRLYRNIESHSELELRHQELCTLTLHLCDECYKEWIENPVPKKKTNES